MALKEENNPDDGSNEAELAETDMIGSVRVGDVLAILGDAPDGVLTSILSNPAQSDDELLEKPRGELMRRVLSRASEDIEPDDDLSDIVDRLSEKIDDDTLQQLLDSFSENPEDGLGADGGLTYDRLLVYASEQPKIPSQLFEEVRVGLGEFVATAEHADSFNEKEMARSTEAIELLLERTNDVLLAASCEVSKQR